jgi:hypothetical protein
MNIRAKLVEICNAFNAHDLDHGFADDCVLEMPKRCERFGPRFGVSTMCGKPGYAF